MNISKELDEECPNIKPWAKSAAMIIANGLAGAYSSNIDSRIHDACYDSFRGELGLVCGHDEAIRAIRKLQVYAVTIQANRELAKLFGE